MRALLLIIIVVAYCASSESRHLPCVENLQSCRAYLAYHLYKTDSPHDIAEKLFDNQTTDIFVDRNTGSLLVGIKCLCSSDSHNYSAYIRFVAPNNMNVHDIVQNYRGLAWSTDDPAKRVNANASLIMKLYCGCPDRPWKYYLSYIDQDHETPEDIVSEHLSNLPAFLTANNLKPDESLLYTDEVYYVPIKRVTGIPLSDYQRDSPGEGVQKSGMSREVVIIIGITAGAAAVLLTTIVVIFLQRRRIYSFWNRNSDEDYGSIWGSLKTSLRSTPSSTTPSFVKNNSSAVSKEMSTLLEAEKPVCFKFEEIVAGTKNFAAEKLLGHTWYGSSYCGNLRGEEFDIKRIAGRPTPEMVTELKILCRVHHANLLELIGYAWNEDELFLIYEYAENGPLSEHLYEPLAKDLTPFTWNARTQIALDIARGLEYIHEHTLIHYVHSHVRTDNILLDFDYKAKIAEFGLSRILQKIGMGSSTSIIEATTLVYMAPEFLKQRLATPQSDVYAFGVFLFELISGQRAAVESDIICPETPTISPLLPTTLVALRKSSLQTSKPCEWADPNLFGIFPNDILYKMASLVQQCLEDDPHLRPSMKDMVYNLSHILLESIEWDAAQAGESSIFSRIENGR